MRVKLLALILITVGQLCYGQVDFKSTKETFAVKVPVDPTEKFDTVETEFGQLPRYLMMAKTVDHGKNLLYVVEILDLTYAGKEINIDNLKLHYIKRKSSSDIGFKLIKEETISGTTKPYEIELIFADKHGMSLDFVRLFIKDSKFYSIETIQLKGTLKLGTKPTKMTQDYFDSFNLNN
jgi:hypothetical protein